MKKIGMRGEREKERERESLRSLRENEALILHDAGKTLILHDAGKALILLPGWERKNYTFFNRRWCDSPRKP